MINQREQDGASKAYLRLLKTTLTRFAANFPGDLIEVDTHQIDAWLRSLDVAAYTRNSMLRCIKILFYQDSLLSRFSSPTLAAGITCRMTEKRRPRI